MVKRVNLYGKNRRKNMQRSPGVGNIVETSPEELQLLIIQASKPRDVYRPSTSCPLPSTDHSEARDSGNIHRRIGNIIRKEFNFTN
jgi:hypothetical protein